MMKKLIPLSAAALAIMLSAQANAAAVAITGNPILRPSNCAALANDVQIQLSENVNASFNCDAVSFVAATCHTNGTNKSQTIAGQKDASGNWLPGYTNCDASGICTFTGRVGYRGSSDGGRVGAVALNAVSCDATSVKAITPDSMLDTGTSTSTGTGL